MYGWTKKVDGINKLQANLSKHIMIQYTPIAVAFKRQHGTKVRVVQFNDVRCPDLLITKKSNKLPKGCEILELGVGKDFYEIYKKKYRDKL